MVAHSICALNPTKTGFSALCLSVNMKGDLYVGARPMEVDL